MISKSGSITKRLLKLLQDDTRLLIYVHLIVFRTMTLKELSQYTGKGKTTIHHHIRKFEEEKILKWEEKEEDRKKLKTRHYYISDVLMKEMSNEGSRVDRMDLDALISNNLTKLMLDYMKNRSDSISDELKVPPILAIPLSNEGVELFNEFIQKLSQLSPEEKINREEKGKMISHIGTYSLIPIKEIMERKLKQNIAED
jgi:DNA-binding Lrp family transcriptional regulator